MIILGTIGITFSAGGLFLVFMFANEALFEKAETLVRASEFYRKQEVELTERMNKAIDKLK
jgi:hypothetical protein